MRYKVAPPARSLAVLADARAAIPLVPEPEADCCRAIQQATDCGTRDEARTLLTFLQALDLVAESERGYYRTQRSLDREQAGAAFRQQVFLVAELLGALEDGPLDVEGTFAAVRDEIPPWERNRHADWTAVWRERVANLLEWGVIFDLLTADGEGYALAAQ
ncbi:hypothetical protein ACFQGE_14495 [Halomicroarcula sp. GCM10025817]|uniref:hypothetical protein n=1 Tax=Haloarcula TaxID=2237 RepID=UPI0023E8C7AF|nr:hypothetical protein [Halomicroarcula sp. SYNS111]